jgi:hypothetical protein
MGGAAAVLEVRITVFPMNLGDGNSGPAVAP